MVESTEAQENQNAEQNQSEANQAPEENPNTSQNPSEEPAEQSSEPTQEESQVNEPKEESPLEAKKEETETSSEPKKEEAPQERHDDFDWSIDKKNVQQYTQSDIAEGEKFYDGTFKTIDENVIILGTVVGITKSDVVLDIGFKSDGLVPLNEFRDMPDLSLGNEVEVYVKKREDLKGQLVLSRRDAKLLKAWENIVTAHRDDQVVKGKIVSKTKGGLIVDVFGLETFLPGSQIQLDPISDYDAFVGKTMEFKVVKINETIKNAVVSHKALIESDREAQRAEIISQLEKGQILEGKIKNITDFGAFIDLGGVDGLLYITDISYGRINHPSEVLELGQTIRVAVLEFDEEKKRISLGLKQLLPHPWEEIDPEIKEGSKVKGKIVNIEDYGAFLEIKPGIEGLIHVSEVSWSNQPIHSKNFFNIGDEHEAVVVKIDKEDRKMSLSIRMLTEDPWESMTDRFPIDSKHSGLVKNITPYGVFVEMEDEVGGMIHISDLSWTKRFNHPNEFTKVGEKLDVVVLEVDKEERKIKLGHKQIEEDPWDTFETVFPLNSVHDGTVIKRDDKGGIVSLPYGVEAFSPGKHLKKEDGSSVEKEETLQFKVIEFNRDDKRILVSHTRIHSDAKREEAQEKTKERKKNNSRTRSAIASLNNQTEKSTLGDLDALAQLREQMKATEGEEEPKKEDDSKKEE